MVKFTQLKMSLKGTNVSSRLGAELTLLAPGALAKINRTDYTEPGPRRMCKRHETFCTELHHKLHTYGVILVAETDEVLTVMKTATKELTANLGATAGKVPELPRFTSTNRLGGADSSSRVLRTTQRTYLNY